MAKLAKLLVDTGPIIRHLRGHQQTVRLLRGLGRIERISISVVTRLEIHAGMHPDERYQTQKLLSRFVTIDLTASIADRTGDLMRSLQQAGQGISVPDAIIATTALTHRLTLVTHNQAHFAIVPGLSLYPFS
ncbi:MAG: type II toxin-antitoxin system VapC family toxin [Caldilineaceae bacterium]|nr:type II toxin-antitoxin system VapC family toxin [Caldilineaceae bacterium]